jgi:hypothetical protein
MEHRDRFDDPAPRDATFQHTYGIRRNWIVLYNAASTALLFGFAIFLSIYETHRAALLVLRPEHGPVELATFAAFLAGALIAAHIAWRARGQGPRRVTWFYGLIAIFMFVCAMEEISWGQWLFHYQTPEVFVDANEQAEVNIHNLPGFMPLQSVYLIVFGAAGLIGIALGRRPRFRQMGVPEALAAAFWVIAVMGALTLVVDLADLPATFERIVDALAEGVEMLGAFAALITLWLNWRMLRRSLGPAPGPAPALSGSPADRTRSS